MPRCDGEGSIVALDTLKLATPLYGFLGGSIDAAGILAEVEGGFTHSVDLSLFNHLRIHFLLEPLLVLHPDKAFRLGDDRHIDRATD